MVNDSMFECRYTHLNVISNLFSVMLIQNCQCGFNIASLRPKVTNLDISNSGQIFSKIRRVGTCAGSENPYRVLMSAFLAFGPAWENCKTFARVRKL